MNTLQHATGEAPAPALEVLLNALFRRWSALLRGCTFARTLH